MSDKWFQSTPAYFPLHKINFAPYRDEIKKELNESNELYWFKDKYRNCDMAMIYSNGGAWENRSSINSQKQKSLQWTPFGKQSKRLSLFLTKEVFPMLLTQGRVTVIRTAPGQSMFPHYDCSVHETSHYIPKIRFVVSGDSSGLYFMSNNGDKSHIPQQFNSYVIDGTRAHGMTNKSETTKYTICIGSPWIGHLTEKGEKVFQESFNINRQHILTRDNYNTIHQEIKFQN